MEQFRFANSAFLNLLFIIPVLIILFIIVYRMKRKAVSRFADLSLMQQLVPDISKSRPIWKFSFLMIALSAIIIALARPQFGTKLKEVKRKGIELMIALDVSNSMLAEDITQNRLGAAKRALEKLVDKLENDRIGLIVFAGDAYLQIPITSDYAAVKLYMSTINTSIVPKQGTAIGSAIELARNSFDPNSNLEKALIIITDGENHEDDPIKQAKKAAEEGIRIFTIGMGSQKGAPIPMDKQYGQKIFRKDQNGNIVISKLDIEILQKIASIGNGKFIAANNADIGLNKVMKALNKLEQREIDAKVYADYDDQYQYLAGIALFFLIIEVILLERKNKWFSKINLFKERQE